MSVRSSAGGLVYLCFVDKGEWLYEPIPVVVMLCDIVSKSGYYRFVEIFCLAAILRVIRRRDEVYNVKGSTNFCKEFGDIFRTVIRKDEQRDATW